MNQTLTNIENLALDIASEKNKILDQEARKTRQYQSFSQKYIGIGGISFGLMIILTSLQLYYLKR